LSTTHGIDECKPLISKPVNILQPMQQAPRLL
jgi:hypothetical protein